MYKSCLFVALFTSGTLVAQEVQDSLSMPGATSERAALETLDLALAHTTLVLAKFLRIATSRDGDLVTILAEVPVDFEKFSEQPVVWQDLDGPSGLTDLT